MDSIKGGISFDSSQGKAWFYDIDGTQRAVNIKGRTIYMPYDIDPKNYSSAIRSFMASGWVIQLEIV